MKKALCPGSFDPPTNGHIDVVTRTAAICDGLIVGVVDNPSKTPLFTSEERVSLLREILADIPNASVEPFSGLLVDFAYARGITAIVKGLRAVTDFDYELQMAQMNYTLRGIETLFIPTNPEWSFISSSLVREVARLGGSVESLVPGRVAAALKEKFK